MTERIAPAGLITKQEAADYLHVTVRTIDRYIKANILTAHYTPTKRVRLAAADVLAAVAKPAAA
jgi:excisionase family DNA binding protein